MACFFHSYIVDGSFNVTIYRCNERDSQLDFSHDKPGIIYIEQIKVNEENQC